MILRAAKGCRFQVSLKPETFGIFTSQIARQFSHRGEPERTAEAIAE